MTNTTNSVFNLKNKGKGGKSTALYTKDMRGKQGNIYTDRSMKKTGGNKGP